MAESPVTQTTRRIAFSLMALFAICLLTTLAMAVYFYYRSSAESPDDKWLSTFKDGFAFLAGALATIIGYYFGNRNTDVAYERAREATDRAETASRRVKEAEAVNETLKKEFIDVASKDDAVETETSPFLDEGGLIKPNRSIK